MDGRNFLATARLLLHEGKDEADYRSAVSRAYYACFIAVRDMSFKACHYKAAKKMNWSVGHDKLWAILDRSSTKEVKRLRQALSDLCAERKKADYKMLEKINENRATTAIDNAQALLELLDLLSKAPENELGKVMNEHVTQNYPGTIPSPLT